MVAANLARHAIPSVLIEGGGRLGRGIAYSTHEAAHVLNVPAHNMSAWTGDPGHFERFHEEHGGDGGGFAERRLYARYLARILDDAVAQGCVTIVHGGAAGAHADGDGWMVEASGAEPIRASALVLAMGNQPPQPFRVEGDAAGFIANPWGAESRAAVEHVAATGSDVLILGTGLTMVDMVLSLDSAGHRGAIVALSRRGLIPRGHADPAPAATAAGDVPTGSVRALWRWLRRHAADLGWRAAVDALRPHSHRIWQALGAEEQRRFLRHARPWWDVHRHRIAPEVARKLHDLIADERLEIIAARVIAIRGDSGGIVVRYRSRGSSHEAERRFARVFNCTGPLGSVEATSDPMLRQMLGDGLVRPDELGIGLEVDERSRAAGARRLWAVGPLTKGRYWEIVAVPDIRGQAAAVAEDIARELGR